MRRDEPGWWYDEHARLMPAVLVPLSFVYGAIAGRRLQREPAYRSRLPVICIGNFTVGGSGKTPFAAFTCDWLARHGRKPAILSRGYGGSSPGPRFVRSNDVAAAVGDEALLLAKSAPTVVASDRAAGARLIEADPRRFDAIVMDDGFQNRSLAKTLSIVLVTARRGLGNGRTLPGGPLRAPLETQAPFADVVVVVDGLPPVDEHRRALLHAHLSARIGRPILDVRVEPSSSVGSLTGKRLIAYCGIAGPERFFASLEALDATVVERTAFRDHHHLTDGEASDLLQRARKAGADLVTTEKDLARLSGQGGARGELREASIALPVQVKLPAGQEAQFDSLLAKAIGLS